MKKLPIFIYFLLIHSLAFGKAELVDTEPGLGPNFWPETKILVDDQVSDSRFGCRRTGETIGLCSVGSGRSRSPVERVIDKQSGVRNQGQRGTCAIFATLAYVEWALIQMGWADHSIDLSEEWLQYLAVRHKQEDGARTWVNFDLLNTYGPIAESSWPYDAEIWKEDSPKTRRRCAYVLERSSLLKSCMLVHRDPRLLEAPLEDLLDRGEELYDPEFASFVTEARRTQFTYRELLSKPLRKIKKVSTLKMLLNRGIPVMMIVPFYYGAWNHGKKSKLGLGDTDYEAWVRGEVGFPEPDSEDSRISRLPENQTGHVILLVGYDDDKVIKTTYLKRDGSIGEKEYRGVYYFKNSWGQHSFGRDFKVGTKYAPGFGQITQKHAHEHGEFIHMDINPRITVGLQND